MTAHCGQTSKIESGPYEAGLPRAFGETAFAHAGPDALLIGSSTPGQDEQVRLTGSGAGEIAGRIALIALFACMIAMSAFNSALRTDSHHWGLMLSNALDLSAGRIPYRDFVILHGYFTTLVQSVWGSLFGFGVLSFGILTAMVYCGLFYHVYAVIR